MCRAIEGERAGGREEEGGEEEEGGVGVGEITGRWATRRGEGSAGAEIGERAG